MTEPDDAITEARLFRELYVISDRDGQRALARQWRESHPLSEPEGEADA